MANEKKTSWLDSFIQSISNLFNSPTQTIMFPKPTPTAAPTPTPTPSMSTDQYLQQQAGGQDLSKYYPAYPMVATKSAQMQQQYNKPGLADLMKLQGFFESTLGKNVAKPFNYFGFAPTNQNFTGYGSDIEAADKWGQNLSGQRGYFYPILKNNPGQPITTQDIQELYTNKPGQHGTYGYVNYLPELLNIWKQLGYQ